MDNHLNTIALKLVGVGGLIVFGLLLLLIGLFIKIFIVVCLLSLNIWLIVQIIRVHKRKAITK